LTLVKVSIPSSGSIQFLLSIPFNKLFKVNRRVSIPSSGSIQFLLEMSTLPELTELRVSIPSSGSIQFLLFIRGNNIVITPNMSQSPQAGQFNSYGKSSKGLPRAYQVSIPSSGSIQFLLVEQFTGPEAEKSLNPLKRVNSILTRQS